MLLSRPLAQMIGSGLILLLAMTIHEYAHCYVADRMGDPTPRQMGRMTLNPFVHINWVGWLMWVVVGFGILGSAPINEYRMRDRRWGLLWSVAAGPLSNLVLAILFALPFRLGLVPITSDIFIGETKAILPTGPQLLYLGVSLNLLLFLFNLLPFYPLDGWHILLKILPSELGAFLKQYERYSSYILLGLILLSFAGMNILGPIMNPPMLALMRLFMGL